MMVCHGLFALPLGIIGRLCSAIMTFTGHLIYNKSTRIFSLVSSGNN